MFIIFIWNSPMQSATRFNYFWLIPTIPHFYNSQILRSHCEIHLFFLETETLIHEIEKKDKEINCRLNRAEKLMKSTDSQCRDLSADIEDLQNAWKKQYKKVATLTAEDLKCQTMTEEKLKAELAWIWRNFGKLILIKKDNDVQCDGKRIFRQKPNLSFIWDSCFCFCIR